MILIDISRVLEVFVVVLEIEKETLLKVAEVDPLIQHFNLSQRSQYSTHIYGGLLDLVFDTSKSKLFLLYHYPTVITLFFFSRSDHYK